MAPNDRFRARKQPRQARGDPGLHRVLFEEAPRSPALLARLREDEIVAMLAGYLRSTAADPTAARPPA